MQTVLLVAAALAVMAAFVARIAYGDERGPHNSLGSLPPISRVLNVSKQNT